MPRPDLHQVHRVGSLSLSLSLVLVIVLGSGVPDSRWQVLVKTGRFLQQSGGLLVKDEQILETAEGKLLPYEDDVTLGALSI